MIQLGKLILDFGQANDWSVILSVRDLELFYFAFLFCMLLYHTIKIEKILNIKLH